ncbi:PLC-like phosphodiesterase [Lyophyllum atratum]|nr:PLC-like phosphodiesterase [Lyophyllum atratum]
MLLFRKTLTQVVISLFCSVTAVQALAPVRRATVCNGHAELCERGYGTVSFVGAHDSYAVGVNNLAVNQDQDITTQLNDGIRMLQMQAHLESGVLRLCHTSCSLYDAGSLQDYLTTVKSWLDTNPNEVLSLLIVNIDNVPVAQYDTVFKAAGVDTLSFVPASASLPASSWPTLGSMIDSGKRLVTFLDNKADPTVAPYIIDEFSNIWETAFNVVDPAQFDCSVNRTHGEPATQMSLINHFLDRLVFNQPVPDVAKANITNSASGPGSLKAHVDTCVAINSRAPNFLLVDFYEFGGGSVFQVAADINKVTYAPTSPIAKPLATSSGAASPTGSSGAGSGTGSSGALANSPRKYLMESLVVAGIVFGAYAVI